MHFAAAAVELDCRYAKVTNSGGSSTCSGEAYLLAEKTCCYDTTVATNNVCNGGGDCDGGKLFSTEPNFACCEGKYVAFQGNQICCGGKVCAGPIVTQLAVTPSAFGVPPFASFVHPP